MAYPEWPTPAAAPSWILGIHLGASLKEVPDDRAPPVALGAVVPGGTRLVQSQSDCPFQAVARHRLSADAWPAPLLGLSPQERGLLVHASFAAFWEPLREHAALVSLDESALASRIVRAVESGIVQLLPTRWRGLPDVVRAGETQRLAGLLKSWLAIDRNRPPFTVCAIELRTTLKLAGIALNLRFDRIDRSEERRVGKDSRVRW